MVFYICYTENSKPKRVLFSGNGVSVRCVHRGPLQPGVVALLNQEAISVYQVLALQNDEARFLYQAGNVHKQANFTKFKILARP